MINRPTTFVVGAGASCEFGLPSGEQLKNQIAQSIWIEFEHGHRLSRGAPDVLDAVRRIEQKLWGKGDINPLLEAGWKIRDAMPIAPSIDNFVHTHRDDIAIVNMAKLGIVHSICASERISSLARVKSADGRNTVSLAKVNGTWIEKFWRIVVEGVERSDLETAFRNVSFIVFNYDRCVEHFLFTAMQVYFGIDEKRAAKIVDSIRIYHPYGIVGPLPWQSDAGSIAFGSDHIAYVSAIERIKTFTELEVSDLLDKIKSQIAKADTIVFLGFSFLDLNMMLLRPEATSVTQRIFVTAYQISEYNTDLIRKKLNREHSGESVEIILRNDLTCSGLFDHFQRGITLPA